MPLHIHGVSFFGDDSLFFFKDSESGCRTTKKVLEDYEEVAVQPLIEVNKCLLIIKTFLWGREAIEAWLGVQAMRSFGLYLRLRLYNGCDKGHISDRSRKG